MENAKKSEYGNIIINHNESILFKDIDKDMTCWMSHTDHVTKLPGGFSTIASSQSCEFAAFENKDKNLYGVQFHPEVNHTPIGNMLLKNFL